MAGLRVKFVTWNHWPSGLNAKLAGNRSPRTSHDGDPTSQGITNATESVQTAESNPVALIVDQAVELTQCSLRLANLPNLALDRLSRMKLSFGAKRAGSSMHSMRWIAANHRSEGAVFNLCSLAH